MTERNRYAMPCAACRTLVVPLAGFLVGSPLRVRCGECLAPPPGEAPGEALVSAGLLPWRGSEMAPFQVLGARWLASRRSSLLADEPGLSKTVQALAALPLAARVLVVCPAGVRGTWIRHAERCRPDLPVATLIGRGSWFRWSRAPDGVLVVTNYDILPPAELVEQQGAPDVVVFDEAHFLKSPKAARSQRSKVIADATRKAGGSVIALTATPIKKSPEDLYALLGLLDLHAATWPSLRDFVIDFGGHRGAFGLEFTGKVRDCVPGILRKVMLRRTKKEAAPQLPEKIFEERYVPIDAETSRLCDEAVEALRAKGLDLADLTSEALASFGGVEAEDGVGAVSKAYAALAAAKIGGMVPFLDELEEAGEAPILLWAWHKAPLIALEQREGWGVIRGGVSQRKRQELEDAFQGGKLKGLACSIFAAGVGITLTAAKRVVFLEQAFTNSENEQAEDRAHRLGRVEPVLYTLLVSDHALDQRIADILWGRRRIVEASVAAATTSPKG